MSKTENGLRISPPSQTLPTMKTTLFWSSITLAFAGSLAASADLLPSWPTYLEEDWLLQARIQTESQAAAHLTPADDAAGGCDGITNGQFGFHTAEQENPWWQVDLGEILSLSQVRIWNRTDSEEVAKRARHFSILISNDGNEWQQIHQHDGSTFYGYYMPDRSPLIVRLTNAPARFVRVQLPGQSILHLDEVEVQRAGSTENVALHKPADQSSLSQWSAPHRRNQLPVEWTALARQSLAATRRMLRDLSEIPPSSSHPNSPPKPLNLRPLEAELDALAHAVETSTNSTAAQSLYCQARALQRSIALASPLLDFDSLVFTKRVPGSYNHMSDQYYGWWSRPGGGIHILHNFKSAQPSTECLTDQAFPEPGSFLRPALSHDAKKILFAWCKFYPQLAQEKDKLNKTNVPEDAFYHLYEMNIDGSGVRQLSHGKYDDFDGRYLPDGRIVFLSTRRGQAIQVGKSSASATLLTPDLPDCYVRCGGDASRPVAVYTLHTMNADGTDLIPISPFEMFEWEPSIAHDGTILYSRWDYVDRDNMPYMSLWSINPDGTNARLVYGNYTKVPHCTFEPRPIPASPKIIFTASGHHSQTMGSLVLLDPALGNEGSRPVTRLTPETPFPEIEGWPRAFYANPWPLSESSHLVSWGIEENMREGRTRSTNAMGLYLFNAEAGLELLYRDPDISSMYPLPLKSQPTPPALASTVSWDGPQEGRFLVADVTHGLKSVQPGDVKALRIIAIPAKTQPWMNQPVLGLTRDDPGKAVLGTVPVEPDGSAHFRVPSGVALFFQALDSQGRAIQTMRSATHVQPGQTLSCTGCHDPRQVTSQPPRHLLAFSRPPSRITPGPDGSWTLRFDRLIQPVLDSLCVRCHSPQSQDIQAAQFDLTPDHAYKSLTHSGKPSLNDLILSAYREGVSTEGNNPALRSTVLQKLSDPAGHYNVILNRDQLDRFVTWMDVYAQRAGSFSPQQETELERLRLEWADLLEDQPPPQTARIEK